MDLATLFFEASGEMLAATRDFGAIGDTRSGSLQAESLSGASLSPEIDLGGLLEGQGLYGEEEGAAAPTLLGGAVQQGVASDDETASWLWYPTTLP